MIVHGKDIHFKLTTGASGEIANLCPDRDINRIGEMLNGAYGDTLLIMEKFCRILNKWYVRSEKYEGRDADMLDEGEILVLDPNQYKEITAEAMASFTGDAKTEVKAKPVKSKKAVAEESR